jgi:hypothetical protein
MDPLWQFIKDGFDQLREEFITAQHRIAVVIHINKKKLKTNEEKMEVKTEAKVVVAEAKMKMVLYEQSSIKKASFFTDPGAEAQIRRSLSKS